MRKSGYINQKLARISTYRELPAASARMLTGYVIHYSDNVCGGGSEIERPRRFRMQMIIHRNDSLAVNNHYLIHIIRILNMK